MNAETFDPVKVGVTSLLVLLNACMGVSHMCWSFLVRPDSGHVVTVTRRLLPSGSTRPNAEEGCVPECERLFLLAGKSHKTEPYVRKLADPRRTESDRDAGDSLCRRVST